MIRVRIFGRLMLFNILKKMVIYNFYK